MQARRRKVRPEMDVIPLGNDWVQKWGMGSMWNRAIFLSVKEVSKCDQVSMSPQGEITPCTLSRQALSNSRVQSHGQERPTVPLCSVLHPRRCTGLLAYSAKLRNWSASDIADPFCMHRDNLYFKKNLLLRCGAMRCVNHASVTTPAAADCMCPSR